MRYYILFLLCLGLTVSVHGQVGKVEVGIASFYHDKFVGRKTANGEIYSQEKLTAAHKSLPLGSWVKVTNLSNDSVVIVRINDRMPQSNKRSIDLTERAARQLNFIAKGLTKVRIEVIPAPDMIPAPRDLPVNPISQIRSRNITLSEGQPSIIGISYPVDWEVYDTQPKVRKWWRL